MDDSGKDDSKWPESVEMSNGKPLHMEGHDYRLPGPYGGHWVIVAGVGSVTWISKETECERG